MPVALWRSYELVTNLALERMVARAPGLGPLHCQQTPESLSVIADFVLGPLADPVAIVQVTHSGSKKDSSRKFWRNAAELFEAQVLLSDCAVVGLYFGPQNLKADTLAIERSTMSALVEVCQTELSGDIDALADRIRTGAVDGAIKFHDLSRTDARTIEKMSVLLEKTIEGARRSNETVFLAARRRLKSLPVPPAARPTSFSRGFAKLLLFPDPMCAFDAAKSGRTLERNNLPPQESGICEMRIGAKGQIVDKQVRWLADNVDRSAIEGLLAYPDICVLDKYLAVLRCLSDVGAQLRWLYQNWRDVRTPKGLFGAMRRSHEQSHLGEVENRYSWVYYVLVEALKQASGKRQGFGLSQVLGEIERLRTTKGHEASVSRLIGHGVARFRAVRSIERLISVQLFDRTSAGSARLFETYATDMAEVALALAARLSNLSRDSLAEEHASAFRQGLYQLQFECNVAAPKGVDFLKVLAQMHIERHGRQVVRVNLHGALVEKALAGGADLRGDAGLTETLLAGRTLLHAQSSYENHPADKTKELSARASALRWSWRRHAYLPREGIDRLVLVVDGDWLDPHLRTLVRAGWDDLFYPDEMNRLVQAVI